MTAGARLFAASAMTLGAALLTFPAAAQKAPPSKRPFVLPSPASADESGFVSLFDGKTLTGWDGDPAYWRVEDGAIVGEVTAATILKDHNSFLIRKGLTVGDFELRLRYRISAEGNSGVNYRSQRFTDPAWTMRGYQFDIDGPAWGRIFGTGLNRMGLRMPSPAEPGKQMDAPASVRVTGQVYDELGRQVLALPGNASIVGPDGVARAEAFFGDTGMVDAVARDGWNDLRIIARGTTIIHMLNGRVVSFVLDEDRKGRLMRGAIGVQVHQGPPMKVEYKDIRLRAMR